MSSAAHLPRQGKAGLLSTPGAEGFAANHRIVHLCRKDQSHLLPAHPPGDSGSDINGVFLPHDLEERHSCGFVIQNSMWEITEKSGKTASPGEACAQRGQARGLVARSTLYGNLQVSL